MKDLLRSPAGELHIKGLRWARALHFFSRLSAASDGTDLNFAANWTVDARWERHRMDFAGGGENLDLWSAGRNYRF